MSNFLAIDCSSGYLSVLGVKGEKSKLKYLPDCAMRHSVILMDAIDEVLRSLSLNISECDFFGVVTGPGSFTGIRIGIATIKGFALAADKPVVGVTAFDLAAYNVEREKFYVLINAAHDCYYACGYNKGEVILPPSYITRAEAETLNPVFAFENLPFESTLLRPDECLYKAVLCGKKQKSEEVKATYIKKSQAEENRR